MVAIQVDCNINVDDVPILERARIRDSMAGAQVHRRADALRKPAVSEGRGVGAGVDDHLAHCSLDLIRRHRRFDQCSSMLQNSSSKLAGV
uniref:IDP454 n=1 Tax=Arundo donax TaxID=35708 RepID=A0A0A9H651_ARUDO